MDWGKLRLSTLKLVRVVAAARPGRAVRASELRHAIRQVLPRPDGWQGFFSCWKLGDTDGIKRISLRREFDRYVQVIFG